MKYILFLLLSQSLISHSQVKDEYIEHGKYLEVLPINELKFVAYSDVVLLDSTIRKEDLYNRSKRFFVDYYKSAKDVIQLDDKENGEVIGKGLFKTMWQNTAFSSFEVSVYHTVQISVKDGKYKYEIKDFILRWFVPSSQYVRASNQEYTIERFSEGYRKKNTAKFFTQINNEVESMITQLKAAMGKPIESKKEW